MTDAWYMTRNGQQYGPYGFEQFKQFAAEGRLAPNDMVMNATEQRWQMACLVPGLLPQPEVKSVPKARAAPPNPKLSPVNISNGDAMAFARSCLLRRPKLCAPELLTLLEYRFLLGLPVDDMLSDPTLMRKRRRWYHDLFWVFHEAKGKKNTTHAVRTVLDETVAKLVAENVVSGWRGTDAARVRRGGVLKIVACACLLMILALVLRIIYPAKPLTEIRAWGAASILAYLIGIAGAIELLTGIPFTQMAARYRLASPRTKEAVELRAYPRTSAVRNVTIAN